MVKQNHVHELEQLWVVRVSSDKLLSCACKYFTNLSFTNWLFEVCFELNAHFILFNKINFGY